jgi:hypothetical protein
MLHACFYTICLVFRYTSWHFYAFSGTNLLTRCHSASSLFSVVFVFQKSYIGNLLGIGQNKSQTCRNSPKLPENRKGDGVEPRGAHTTGQPRSTSDDAPSPIKTPRREKPKDPITFPETYRDPLLLSTRDREGPEALPGTPPERGIAIGGLLHRHACLQCDECVVYLGLWVHSSS